jgi:hypothetical protein
MLYHMLHVHELTNSRDSKDWMAVNQDNVSELSDIFTHGWL